MECQQKPLAYTTDTITFASTERGYLEMIMKVLQEYELVLGQMVNKEKNNLYMIGKTTKGLVHEVE